LIWRFKNVILHLSICSIIVKDDHYAIIIRQVGLVHEACMDKLFSEFGTVSARDQLPGSYLLRILETLIENGIDPAKYLETVGLANITDDAYWDEFSYQKYLSFAEAVLKANVPALAFRTGLKFSILELGLVGYWVISSPNLRVSLNALGSHGELMGAGHVVVEYLREKGNDAIYTIECSLDSAKLYQFELELNTAQFLSTVPYFMFNKDFNFTQVNYSFPRPDHAELIEELVSCPVSWDQAATELIFERSWLDAPLFSTNELIAGFCEQNCRRLLTQVSSDNKYSEKLRRRIRRYPARIPSMSNFAAQNNLSTRSLYRRLLEEGTSYHKIVHTMRMSLAGQSLQRTNRSIKNICFQLGYSEVSNFHRAFTLWSGITPTRYREQTRIKNRDSFIDKSKN
jgi:AraC-like DNA-binding protein